jgi:dihydroorotase
MANTSPVNDNESVTHFIVDRAEKEACVNILPVGAITKGLAGESLTEIGGLKEAGIVALSDDGMTVKNAEVMRRGLEYARSFSVPVICHCEDSDLCQGGVMHEGVTSAYLGLRGSPSAAEEIIVQREIALSELAGHPVHIAHVSTAGSAGILREAKARGVRVTAETAPHYFSLTEQEVAGFDTAFKVNPPLRSAQDVQALKEGLQDGTIDVIASDHAPHSSLEKAVEFDKAAFGIIGLETSLSLTLCLVFDRILTLSQAIEKYTVKPAEILKIDKGRLREGADADITIIDLESEFTVNRDTFKSKSKNSPFHGRRLKGRAVYTIVSGQVVFSLK